MPKPELPPLSEAQLEIINIIWDQGNATVGKIWKLLAIRRSVSRNTVSTMVTRLEEMGWLRHRVIGGTFLYSVTHPREKVLPRMTGDPPTIVYTSIGRRPRADSILRESSDRSDLAEWTGGVCPGISARTEQKSGIMSGSISSPPIELRKQ
jgi:hypothetical protein